MIRRELNGSKKDVSSLSDYKDLETSIEDEDNQETIGLISENATRDLKSPSNSNSNPTTYNKIIVCVGFWMVVAIFVLFNDWFPSSRLFNALERAVAAVVKWQKSLV